MTLYFAKLMYFPLKYAIKRFFLSIQKLRPYFELYFNILIKIPLANLYPLIPSNQTNVEVVHIKKN